MRKLGRPGDRLREYREYLGLTLEEIEARYGVKGSTWSYAETEGKGISSKILDALRKGEPPAGKARVHFTWLMEGLGEMLEAGIVSEPAPTYVTGMLPEHIQEAYDILMAAVEASGTDIKKLDRRRTGLVVGLIAEEVAKGLQGEIRQTLIRRAEVLLGLKG